MGFSINEKSTSSYVYSESTYSKLLVYNFENNFDIYNENQIVGGTNILLNKVDESFFIIGKNFINPGPYTTKINSFYVTLHNDEFTDTIYSIEGTFYYDSHNFNYKNYPLEFNNLINYKFIDSETNPIFYVELNNGDHANVYKYQKLVCFNPFFEGVKWEIEDNVYHYAYNPSKYTYKNSTLFHNELLNGFLYEKEFEEVKLWAFRNIDNGDLIFEIPLDEVSPFLTRTNSNNVTYFFESKDDAYNIYLLKNIKDISGEDTTGDDSTFINGKFQLIQNYPNPFNSYTIIEYSIDKQNFVSLIIYDALGRKVETLVNQVKSPGNYKVHLYSDNLASGIYFYRLNAGNSTKVKKLVIIK